jgi:hypothetical protein
MQDVAIIGDPDMNVLSIGSDSVDMFAVADMLEKRHWRIDRQASPRAIHLIVTPNHIQSIGAFLDDLRAAVDAARAMGNTRLADGQAALYGVTTRVGPADDAAESMRRAMDDVYRV